MTLSKKGIILEILETLEGIKNQISNQDRKYFDVFETDEYYLHLIDKDRSSGFYFIVKNSATGRY
jgi:hypothetical protein